jgi:hypothetical protein
MGAVLTAGRLGDGGGRLRDEADRRRAEDGRGAGISLPEMDISEG